MAARGAESEYRIVIEELDNAYAKAEDSANELIRQKRYEEAEAKLREFCEEYKDTPQASRAVAKISDLNRKWEAESKSTIEMAEKLIKEGKFSEAERLLATEGSAHPLVRSQFLIQREKLAAMQAQQKEREMLTKYNKECLVFYKSIASVLIKGDVEEMRKELESAKKSYPNISDEINMVLKDVEVLASLYNRITDYLKKESEKGNPQTILLASGEQLIGRVTETSHSSFMLNLGVRGVQGVQMRDLALRFVENTAAQVYTPDETKEKEFAVLLFQLIVCGDVDGGRAKLEIRYTQFSKILAALSLPDSASVISYDPKSDDAHYARLYKGIEEPLITMAKGREYNRLLAEVRRNMNTKKYEEAVNGIEQLLSGLYDEFLDEKTKQELEKNREVALAKLSKPEKKDEPPVKGLLASLKKYFHAASIRELKKDEVFEFTYDFKDKEQILDWRFNNDKPDMRRVEEMWRGYEDFKQRRRKNYDDVRNFGLVPYGADNAIKVKDAVLRWCAVCEGDVVLEFSIIAMSTQDVKANLCENKDGRYVLGWAISADEEYRKDVLKGARHAILRFEREEGDHEHQELIKNHRWSGDYLALPERFKAYVVQAYKKGNQIKLYVGATVFASGMDDVFNEGTIGINATGQGNFLVVRVRIQCKLQEKWLKEEVLKVQVTKGEEKPPTGGTGDEISDYVKNTRERIKGMTDEDARRLESLLRDSKSWQENAGEWARWARPYDRLKDEVDRCNDVESLRKVLDDAERIRERWKNPGGGNPPPNPGGGPWGPGGNPGGGWGPGGNPGGGGPGGGRGGH
jgi:hypothetical protein